MIAGFFFITLLGVEAQDRCGIEMYQQMLKDKNKVSETTEHFEQWMQQRLSIRKSETNRQERTEAEVVTVPVVVHIIHKGETIGSGLNISDEQILSQIEVLNEDFRRTNADRDNTPTTFQPIAADIEINFELASRDPEGLATTGINRIDGGRDLWFLADNYELKSLSYWPAEDYLNIWVTDLGNDFLGYAQFPVSSSLEGLEEASNSRLTDGVVIDYRTFGSKLKYPPANVSTAYDRGRTTTHEVGHYFGLRHIWGDGNCNVDDFCDDTPLARTDNGGLGLCDFPGPNSCSNDSPDLPDMFQNYMDYTDDVCMNLFTSDQKDRMRVVIDNSPRRASLKNSLGTVPPVIVSNDLGIRTIVSPTISICGDSFTPILAVRNYGDNIISTYELTASIDGAEVATNTFNNSLNLLEIDTVTFEELSLANIDPGKFELTFEITSVNNTTDENGLNDLETVELSLPPLGTAPIALNFNQPPDSWFTSNLDGLRTWELVAADNGEISNQALYVEFYSYENEGAIDLFSSPVISLRDRTTAKLSFDVAYARYPGVELESLTVVMGRQCANPLTDADTIYFKQAAELSTAGNSTGNFSPASEADWRNESIDLAEYLGEESLQITFIAKNAFGNNLYIDNISVDDVENRIVSPSPVSCVSDQELIIEVVNDGIVPVSTVDIAYILDRNTELAQTFNFTSPLQPGFSENINIPLSNLAIGSHTLSVTIQLPNTAETSTLAYEFYIDESSDIVPLRKDFDDLDFSEWVVVNHDQSNTWAAASSNGREYAFMENAGYPEIGERDWLVSPTLDFSNASEITLTFDVAYSRLNNTEDGLALLLSTNCGDDFDIVLYNKVGDDLATGQFNGNPPTPSTWRTESLNLNDFRDLTEVRLAFVNTNRNGNNIYIDDVQIYTTEIFPDAEYYLFPNPSTGEYKLRFDLKERQKVKVQVVNLSGQEVYAGNLDNILNQTFDFSIVNEPAGIYLVRLEGETFSTTERIMKLN
ncbi:T9SS-dependent choice-of-anchor J family protein [Fulvivirga lutea]|uniref:Choice-of-anchor J domain-containing protein n=1 Tax=Fulvivirga lutea TaxID=2810512 RepID=A0A974WMW3_9BACT|nr:choice-of-anchor J domain-containing protein [Fulvivirga lutea]QSE99215.1 choice-of-anchor J domain-containing protein [Fulvivirga lutea]